MKLRMGTRGSPLALAQSGWAARELMRLNPGLEVETETIVTSGDRFQGPPDQSGTKGLFVKEIEEALLARRIDFAVHSAKDLPGQLAPGTLIAAYPEREDPRDALIGCRWADLKPGMRVGTTSPRRRDQLPAGVVAVPLRGNVDTRLRKLKEGEFDAILLAVAGLKRLGLAVDYEPVPADVMLPAPGQGALALQTREGDAAIVASLDHAPTRRAVEAERRFLAEVGGGCSVPLGAYAAGDALTVFWEGKRSVRPLR